MMMTTSIHRPSSAAKHHHLSNGSAAVSTVVDVDDHNIQWLSRDSCLALCQQRRHKLLEDEADLNEMRDELMRSQKTTLINGLCTLSRDVKKMTVKEFNSKFGCDVIDMITRHLALVDNDCCGNDDNDNVVTSSGKKRNRVIGMMQQQQQFPSATDRARMSLKTPAVGRSFGGRPPMTIARTARKGERLIIQSQNGSPVDQYDPGELVITIKKQRRGVVTNNGIITTSAVPSSSSFPINIGIGAGNGETIDLSDPNQRKNLDEEQKAHAMQQLMAMQEQMKNLMAEW